jgi:hypothetical protein
MHVPWKSVWAKEKNIGNLFWLFFLLFLMIFGRKSEVVTLFLYFFSRKREARFSRWDIECCVPFSTIINSFFLFVIANAHSFCVLDSLTTYRQNNLSFVSPNCVVPKQTLAIQNHFGFSFSFCLHFWTPCPNNFCFF